MKKLSKILLYIFAGIGAFYVASLLFLSFGGHTKYVCEVLELRKLTSPSGDYTAHEVQERCGDKSFRTVVWLNKVNEKNKKWSAFIAKMPNMVNQPGHTPVLDLEIRWTAEHRLSITYSKNIVPTTGESEHDGIFVEYHTFYQNP